MSELDGLLTLICGMAVLQVIFFLVLIYKVDALDQLIRGEWSKAYEDDNRDSAASG